MKIETISGVELYIGDSVDSDGDMELDLESAQHSISTWLTKEQARKVISHLESIFESGVKNDVAT